MARTMLLFATKPTFSTPSLHYFQIIVLSHLCWENNLGHHSRFGPFLVRETFCMIRLWEPTIYSSSQEKAHPDILQRDFAPIWAKQRRQVLCIQFCLFVPVTEKLLDRPEAANQPTVRHHNGCETWGCQIMTTTHFLRCYSCKTLNYSNPVPVLN